MKRTIFIVALFLSIFTLSSCEEDRWGYENKVVFSAQGGSEEVDGDEAFHTLSIGTYHGDEKTAQGEIIMVVSYDWLTASAVKGTDEILLVAEPNNTGKKRKLFVYGMVRDRVMDITVIQEK